MGVHGLRHFNVTMPNCLGGLTPFLNGLNTKRAKTPLKIIRSGDTTHTHTSDDLCTYGAWTSRAPRHYSHQAICTSYETLSAIPPSTKG